MERSYNMGNYLTNRVEWIKLNGYSLYMEIDGSFTIENHGKPMVTHLNKSNAIEEMIKLNKKGGA